MEITVNLSSIQNNAKRIRTICNCGICAVVKSDAYGHGSLPVAHAINDLVDCFAVATYCEARELVVGGITKDIIILGSDDTRGEKNIIPTAVSLFDLASKCKYERYNVALNTGMNRLGLAEDEVLATGMGFSSVFSVFSHIYDQSSKVRQRLIFDRVASYFPASCKKHLYSSSYLADSPTYDLVRPGIALYGGIDGYEPAMEVWAEVIKLTTVNKGDNIGYGICRAERKTKIATLKIGYRDGFSRLKNNEKRVVVINGQRCSVIGQVCMDMTMVDVSGTSVKVGDWACVLGKELPLREVALYNLTIPYEILTSFRHREDIIYK